MALVSVLIPVFNTGRWLGETIASVRAQTVGDWEVVAIDDGSTDGSGEILRKLAAEIGGGRMRVIVRENRGLIATRNELLAAAQGELVAWLDSDDRMTQDRLALQLQRFAQEPGLVCLGGAATLTDPDGLPIRTHGFATDHDSLVKAMQEEIAFYFPAVTMRRDAALKVGGFREPFKIGEDYDICLRLSEMGRVGNVPDVVLFYRQHMTSTVNSGRARSYVYADLVRALAKERRSTGTDRLMRGEKVELNFDGLPTARQNAVDTYRRWGWWALHDGQRRTAWKYARKALAASPTSKESWRLLACVARGR